MAATQPIINAEAHEVACAVGVVVLCGPAGSGKSTTIHAALQLILARSGGARNDRDPGARGRGARRDS